MILPAWTFAVNSGETVATRATALFAAPPSTITPLNWPFSAFDHALQRSRRRRRQDCSMMRRDAVDGLAPWPSRSLAAFGGLLLLHGLELLLQFLLLGEQGLDLLLQLARPAS